MSLKIDASGSIKQEKSHRKLIDIPFVTLKKLQKQAKNNRQDLKNYIEHQLILLADRK